MGDLLQLAIYNPAILKDTDFLAGFVARLDTAEDILRALRQLEPRSLAKHRLILGQRGMGKTSLLRRIAIAIRDDEQLSAVWLPLTFREEQYNVHNLHTLWCNCLDALADHYERVGQADKAAALDRQIAALTTRERRAPAAEDEGEEALAALKAAAKAENRRILLLLDNIDLILDGLAKQHWSLRRTLQEAGGPVVIGATTAYLEASADPKGAFYDFFQVTKLERLSQDELMACLRRLAAARGEAGQKARHVLDTDPGRVRALHDLTGGNLRTLVLLYLLLERDADDEVMGDLERLLDEVTPLYKARVEDLAPQARVVLDAVALNWDPATAAALAEATGMDTAAVSTQLDRLSRNGVIEKTSLSTSGRSAFQLGERFFNIWYLMRHGPRRQRSRLRWLTGFLRAFYSPPQLAQKAASLLRGAAEATVSGHYCLALGDAVDSTDLRNLLGEQARRNLEKLAARQGKKLDQIVDPKELPAPQTAEEWLGMGWWLHVQLDRPDEAEVAYRKAIDLDPKDALPWNNLGGLLQDHLGRYDEAESAYRKAIDLDPMDAWPWNNLGNLLQYHLGRYDEAESAYRKAIDLDPKYAVPWCILGNLLQNHLGRYDEAEAAYRKAIDLDPKFAAPWNNLGGLLQVHLGRYDEAEAAYRKAIDLDPKYAAPWNNLGSLLQDCLQRPEEATQAYLECLKREPDDAFAHANLAYQSLASGVQEADRYLEAALAKLPAHGANLLHAFAALARDNFGAATAAFAEALESAHPELYSNYFHDILRLLRLAAARNYGEKLLAWFDLSGHADRNWPLRAAFDAYLHGEARLGDVNPEVGSAARRIFRALGPLPAPATPAPGAAKRAARKTKAS